MTSQKKIIPLIVCGAFGRMGHEVINEALQHENFALKAGVFRRSDKRQSDSPWTFPLYDNVTIALCEHKNAVVIDFSSAHAAGENIAASLRCHAPVLLATTGLSVETLAQAKEAARTIPVVIAPNTSIMANLLTAFCAMAATSLQHFDASILDIHHAKKKDAPSGTALQMAAAIRSKRNHQEIEIRSMRKGNVIGEHTAYFFSENERLELTHRVSERKVFAEGALVAAQFLFGRQPGLYDMNDVLNLNLTIKK